MGGGVLQGQFRDRVDGRGQYLLEEGYVELAGEDLAGVEAGHLHAGHQVMPFGQFEGALEVQQGLLRFAAQQRRQGGVVDDQEHVRRAALVSLIL